MTKIRNQELINAFGKRLMEVRTEKGLSQEALANLADITISQVSRIERGEVNPTLSTIQALSHALKISRSELVDF